jgi:hypothetical protein
MGRSHSSSLGLATIADCQLSVLEFRLVDPMATTRASHQSQLPHDLVVRY